MNQKELWIEGDIVRSDWLSLRAPEGWYTADVRFDGCVHLRHCFNEPNSFESSASDYIHICDLDEIIERLTALKKLALNHFGSNWSD